MTRIRVVQYNGEGNFMVEITKDSGRVTLIDTGSSNVQDAVIISKKIREEFPDGFDNLAITN